MTAEPAQSDTVGFGRLLRRHRGALALTQEELADRSGVSVRAISDLERGRATGPQRRTVELLAAALELDEHRRAGLLRTARLGRARTPVTPAGPPAGPWQLPPDVQSLCGRGRELARLRRVIIGSGLAGRRCASVVFVSGQPGVGKTSLVLRAAHEAAPLFPDGRLFVDLRGSEPEPADPVEVLAALLRSLGLADGQLPPTLGERAGLFRSLVRDRRVLVVLDNAADEAQVRPLLPSGPSCVVLVTSCRVMTGLDGADRVALGVLDARSAHEVLASIVGPDRLAAEPGAVAEVIARCGRLPLALRIAGNRLASRPYWTFRGLAAQLADESDRLLALCAGDTSLRRAFEVSYRRLAEPSRAVFRRLALIPGNSFAGGVLALLAPDVPGVAQALEELVDASLVEPRAGDRYGLPDLARAFARDKLLTEDMAVALAPAA